VKINNYKFGLFLGLCFLALELQAETQFPVCAIPPSLDINKATSQPVKDAVYLEADTGLINRSSVSSLVGNIIIQQNDLVINADKASFLGTNNTVTANGKVVVSNKNIQLNSDSIQYQTSSQSGELKNVRYKLKHSTLNGRSRHVIQKNATQLELIDATYTSCPASINSWHLAAGNIKLDQNKRIGNAKNVTLKIADTPVFYFPWLNFSLDNKRKTGFLIPTINFSEKSGTAISTPLYLNLSPNYDVTITPSYLSKRGLKIDNEFRYLSKYHQGVWEYEILPRDHSFNNKQRDYFKINHSSKISDSIRFNIKTENVSDKEYLNDFRKSLSNSSTPALEHRIEIVKVGKNWRLSAASIDYQTLDSTNSSYSKLPEIKFSYTPKILPKQVNLSLDTELSYFDKRKGPTGMRLDVNLGASRKFGNDAWYFKPSVGLRHTYYNLKNNPTGNRQTRTLPTLSLDAGLFFDRDLAGRKLTQTLEPRLFYTYTPFRDQNDIPLFDTAKTDFSTSTQLFSKNHYTGKDRIADSNQLTVAVTSRIQNRKTGKELLQASVGQIFHFADRKVTLPGETVQTNAQSELAFELGGKINDNVRLSTSSFWDPNTKKWTATETRLNYKDKKNRIANVSYRSLKDELKQASASFSLPINKEWSMIGRVDHDLKNNRNLETLAGIEYQNCCMKTRIVGRKYLTSDNRSYDDAIFLQFELKGLGNLGHKANSVLKDKIYGYE